jgi:hypothetical protein
VAAAADRNRNALILRQTERGGDVVGTGDEDDGGGPWVNAADHDRSKMVVVIVTGCDHAAADGGTKGGEIEGCGGGDGHRGSS